MINLKRPIDFSINHVMIYFYEYHLTKSLQCKKFMKCNECLKEIKNGEGHYVYLEFKYCLICWPIKYEFWEKTS